MNRNERPSHLEDYYSDGRYNVEAFEVANAPAPGSMWTPAYADLIVEAVQFMEAHNLAAGHKSAERAAYWRALLGHGEASVWLVAIVGILMVMV